LFFVQGCHQTPRRLISSAIVGPTVPVFAQICVSAGPVRREQRLELSHTPALSSIRWISSATSAASRPLQLNSRYLTRLSSVSFAYQPTVPQFLMPQSIDRDFSQPEGILNGSQTCTSELKTSAKKAPATAYQSDSSSARRMCAGRSRRLASYEMRNAGSGLSMSLAGM